MDLLFDTPWWLPTVPLGVGLVMLWVGNNRQDKGLLRMGLAGVLLGLSVILISYFVQTDVEKASARSRHLVEAVVSRDWEAMRKLMHERATVVTLSGRDVIVERVKEGAERINLRSGRVTGLSAQRQASSILVNLRIFSEQDQPVNLIATDWRFIWQKSGDEWLLFRIEVLTSASFNEDVLRRFMNR